MKDRSAWLRTVCALIAPALGFALCIGAMRSFGGCSRPAANEVVLYTSSDEFIAQPIVREFERETSIKVRLVMDTEATKTFGLVERLIAEREHPKADVWWSNEMLGSVQLSEMHILEPIQVALQSEPPAPWPAQYCAADGTWHGHALRARVIAFNTNRLNTQSAPTRLRELTRPSLKGLIGMANPRFGTTRVQMAALAAMHGDRALTQWLEAIRSNGVRLYDGNSAVVQALALGEIEVGLTDTDDALGAKMSGKPVDFVFESVDVEAPADELPSRGPLVIPNTVGVVAGAPNREKAESLAKFLLSERVERLLAESDSRNVPIRESLRAAPGGLRIEHPLLVDPVKLREALGACDRAIGSVFGK